MCEHMSEQELKDIKGSLSQLPSNSDQWYAQEVIGRRKNFERCWVVKDHNGFPIVEMVSSNETDFRNAAFISSAPRYMSRLLAEVDRLQSENKQLRKELTRMMDVAINLAAIMENTHQLCPRDCDIPSSEIKCNENTDVNGETSCDGVKCWLNVALNCSGDCDPNDWQMDALLTSYRSMLRNEVRKAIEEDEKGV